MKKMILVTDSFPYGNGESTFILPELKCLSEEFEISIVSCGNSTERTTILPADIGVYKCPKNQTSWAWGCFKSIFTPVLYRDLRHAFKAAKHPFLAAMQCIDYYGESESFAKQFKAVVSAEGKPDIIYCFWHRPALFGILRTKKAYPGVKIVARAHGYDLFAERYPTGYIPYKLQCDELLDGMFLACDAGLKYYKMHYLVSDPAKCSIAYLGVDNNRTAVWESSDTLRLFSCSNIVPVKRINLLIEALAAADSRLKIKWTHVGGGKQEDYMRRFAADKLGGKKNIEYEFLGRLPNESVRDKLASEPYDYFITVSESEGGVPISIVEACSFGLPVIATDVGGVPEIVGEDNGLLIPPDSKPAEIAETLKRAAELKNGDYAALRAHSQQKWRRHFIASENGKRFTRRLVEICEGK